MVAVLAPARAKLPKVPHMLEELRRSIALHGLKLRVFLRPSTFCVGCSLKPCPINCQWADPPLAWEGSWNGEKHKAARLMSHCGFRIGASGQTAALRVAKAARLRFIFRATVKFFFFFFFFFRSLNFWTNASLQYCPWFFANKLYWRKTALCRFAFLSGQQTRARGIAVQPQNEGLPCEATSE